MNGVSMLLTIRVFCGQLLKQSRAKARPGAAANCAVVDETLKIVALFNHSSDRIEALVQNVVTITIAYRIEP